MEKLTHLEANKVLTEAYKLRTQFSVHNGRLGQSIHWTTDDSLSSLERDLRLKLEKLIAYYFRTAYNFYYESDENVLDLFYKYYVGE